MLKIQTERNKYKYAYDLVSAWPSLLKDKRIDFEMSDIMRQSLCELSDSYIRTNNPETKQTYCDIFNEYVKMCDQYKLAKLCKQRIRHLLISQNVRDFLILGDSFYTNVELKESPLYRRTNG